MLDGDDHFFKRMNFQLTTEVWSLLITLSLLVSKLSLYTGIY